MKSDRVRRAFTLLLCLLALVVVALGMWQSVGVSAWSQTALTVPTTVSATGSTTYVPPVPTTVPAVVTVPDPPKILSAIPSEAPTTGAVEIVIGGVHFSGATKVTFDNIPATSHTVVSDEKITAVAPAHAAGTCDLKVVGPGGTSLPYSFTYVEAPTTTEAPVTTVAPTATTMPATTLAETEPEEEGGLAGGYIALIIVVVVVVVGGIVYVLRKGSRKA